MQANNFLEFFPSVEYLCLKQPYSHCIMCVRYRGGVQYRGGYHEYRGGYLEYRGGAQYRGGIS